MARDLVVRVFSRLVSLAPWRVPSSAEAPARKTHEPGADPEMSGKWKGCKWKGQQIAVASRTSSAQPG